MTMSAVPSGPPESGKKRVPVAGGGGPPYDGDMDRRLTVLETRFDTILPTLATKADLAELRLDMNGQMEKLRLDMNGQMEKLRRDLGEKMDALRVELHLALTNMMKWCVGIAMTVFLGMAGHGLYLGTQINILSARLPAASAAAPVPGTPAPSPARTAPPAQPQSGVAG